MQTKIEQMLIDDGRKRSDMPPWVHEALVVLGEALEDSVIGKLLASYLSKVELFDKEVKPAELLSHAATDAVVEPQSKFAEMVSGALDYLSEITGIQAVSAPNATSPGQALRMEYARALATELRKAPSEKLRRRLRGATDKSTIGHALGYPLTVTLSYVMSLKPGRTLLEKTLFKDLATTIANNKATYDAFISLAVTTTRHGYNSAESRQLYVEYIAYTGETSIPMFDVGWLYEYLGTLATYLNVAERPPTGSSFLPGQHSFEPGRHYYRQVPCVKKGLIFCNEYDSSYAVHELPPKKKVRIGLMSDWATGTPAAMHVLSEMHKLDIDLVMHLGDTYYSGSVEEQRDYLMDPLLAQFGEQTPIFLVPGNHDYYSNGYGFLKVVDELGFQNATFWCLRGNKVQILGLDTGLLNNNQLGATLLPFLPDDQLAWAKAQIAEGRRRGLKTIVTSHHQFFSRTETLGVANDQWSETLLAPDRFLYQTFSTAFFGTKAEALPGHLTNEQLPAANTRLLEQFTDEERDYVSAFYWGHEHSTAIYDSFLNVTRGRLIGHAGIANSVDYDQYHVSTETTLEGLSDQPAVPLMPKAKGHCEREGCQTGKGNQFWDLGFVLLEIDEETGETTASHYEIRQDQTIPKLIGEPSKPESIYSEARVYFSEAY